MRSELFPEPGPKRKLIETAERLFAERGFEAVSVRDITHLAKANVAAVNYYFGSRSALIELVMTRLMEPLMARRLGMLAEVEARWPNTPAPVVEILEAFVRPLVREGKKRGLNDGLFYKLLGRGFAQHGDGMAVGLGNQLRDVNARFIRAFAAAVDGVTDEELAWRLHFLSGGVIHLLIHHETIDQLSGGSEKLVPMAETIDRLVRFGLAGLQGGGHPGVPVRMSEHDEDGQMEGLETPVEVEDYSGMDEDAGVEELGAAGSVEIDAAEEVATESEAGAERPGNRQGLFDF